jgi:hypothetical protein
MPARRFLLPAGTQHLLSYTKRNVAEGGLLLNDGERGSGLIDCQDQLVYSVHISPFVRGEAGEEGKPRSLRC